MQVNGNEVAILLATYNGERFIEKQIESILNQTFQDFICYISDDGSNDKTVEIIMKYQKISNGKIKLISKDAEQDSGPTANFFRLIDYVLKFSKEPYIMFCDQDDIWGLDKIEKQISFIKSLDIEKGEPRLVFCDQIVIDDNDNVIAGSAERFSGRTPKDYKFKRLVFRNTVAGCVMCINRSLLEVMGNYMNLDNIVLHDWWAMLIGVSCGKTNYIDIPLMSYRQHGKNSVGVDNRNYLQKTFKYLFHFKSSIRAKKELIEKCKRQMLELMEIKDNNSYLIDICDFCRACEKNKLFRMIYMLKNGYIAMDNLFTVLFV